MNEEQIRKTEAVLIEKQYQRSLIISGHSTGIITRAKADYERTKAWAIKLGLGSKVCPNAIDPEEFQFFSDCYKDMNGFRPRGFTYDQMKSQMRLWINVSTDGEWA